MDSSFAASMNPQVFTTMTSALPAAAGRCPAALRRASSMPESASFLGQPRVWMKKVQPMVSRTAGARRVSGS